MNKSKLFELRSYLFTAEQLTLATTALAFVLHNYPNLSDEYGVKAYYLPFVSLLACYLRDKYESLDGAFSTTLYLADWHCKYIRHCVDFYKAQNDPNSL